MFLYNLEGKKGVFKNANVSPHKSYLFIGFLGVGSAVPLSTDPSSSSSSSSITFSLPLCLLLDDMMERKKKRLAQNYRFEQKKTPGSRKLFINQASPLQVWPAEVHSHHWEGASNSSVGNFVFNHKVQLHTGGNFGLGGGGKMAW
jgi:hypothetical protein